MKVLILRRLIIHSPGDKPTTLRKQANYKNRKKWKLIYLFIFMLFWVNICFSEAQDTGESLHLQVTPFSIQKQLQRASSPGSPELSARWGHPACYGWAVSLANIVGFFLFFHLVESHFKALQGLSLHARRYVGDANKPSYFAVVFLPRAMGWRHSLQIGISVYSL